MSAGRPEWLREHTDEQLLALAQELHERAECFTMETRSLLNDELRRRKLPTVPVAGSRH